MPTIVSSKGQSNIEAIKRYFCSEYACMMVAQAAGVDYERMIAGEYKLLIEPMEAVYRQSEGNDQPLRCAGMTLKIATEIYFADCLLAKSDFFG